MAEYQEITKSEWKKSFLFIIPIVVIVSISAFALLPENWMLYILVVAITICVITIVAVRGEKDVLFKCPTCGQEFKISALKNALSPHGVTKKDGKLVEWKYLECPMCHGKTKMSPIKK
jgi:uncharacterized membrane protein